MVVAKSVTLIAPFDAGVPGPEHFKITESDISEELEDGGILVKIVAMSVDPYLRFGMKNSGDLKAGDVVKGFVAGKVLASKNEKWSVGDVLGGSLPFSTYSSLSKAALASTLLWKLNDFIRNEEELTLGVGVLGMPGSTAYGGLIDVLKVKEGETLFVSAASGAVGSLVGQIAKRVYNCKVIGSCGGPEKCALITEKFGFDHAIDYKTVSTAEELKVKLKEVAPEGIDMYFENVGGMHFDAAFASLRTKGRIAVCGGISQYNSDKPLLYNVDIMGMVYSQLRIEGFICMPWLSGARGNFLADMTKFLREGKVVPQETFFEGVESWPLAFQSLFTGANVGKAVVRV